MTPHPIYRPSEGFRTNLDSFRDFINTKHDTHLASYEDLHNFSTQCLNDFWLAVWEFCGVKGSSRPRYAVDDNAPMFPPPKFFPDVRMNYAENLLSGDDGAVAVIEMNEKNASSPTKYTWRDLRQLVAQYQALLKWQGMKQGDVLVVIGGNCARSLALLLAAASIGAIFAGFATDMGEKQLLDRVGQLQPKVMVAELTYHYNGKVNDITDKVTSAAEKTKCQLIVVTEGKILPHGSKRLSSLLKNEKHTDLKFAQLPFTTPFVVMFSSGTTGTPKGIVHSQGGLTLNGIKEHKIHNNFGPEDIHFHYSSIGWTLWNISIGAMFCQTAMVLYDGSPFYPSCDEFLRSVFATGVTGYGGSPRYFSELQKRNVRPRAYADKMHTLLSTGASLTPGTASWLADAFGPVCQIGISGGMELCGNFMTGTRSMACYPGEIAVKELGMDVEAWGNDGKKLPDGQAGELVCKKPFPNMPVMFWNDKNGERYRKSYFAGFKDVWTHGDLIRINPATKGIYVLGRSPATGVLNPSGVRYGTSELYNIVSTARFSRTIQDSLAIGHQRSTATYPDATERVILFLKPFPSHSSGTVLPKPSIVADLTDQIARDLSRRHVPHFFFEVDEIPHNANGKKMEIQVKQVCNGGPGVVEKMTLGDEERARLREFERFYHVEEVVRKEKKRGAKL